jgi:transcriptional regulator with PAS, ATPase and Fis domain
LIESELFGYEAGAFTGAGKQGKPGMFEMAEKGTLFLDEIGDISSNIQAKLLRALQDHTIMRVGGLRPIAVDARIITATNKDLKEMVKSKSFREDLYYRLNVVSIEIPPLRERREDIPLLVLHLVEKINKKYQFSKRVSPQVIDHFMLYSWPGNIRELQNVTERMLVMTPEEHITSIHLPSNIRSQVHSHGGKLGLDETIPFKKAIESVERQILERALKKYGSTRKAAKALKINQSTVVRKTRKHGLCGLSHEIEESANPFEDPKFRL